MIMVCRANPYLPCKYVHNTYRSRTKDSLSTLFISISRISTFANARTSRHRYRVRYLFGDVIINLRAYDACTVMMQLCKDIHIEIKVGIEK